MHLSTFLRRVLMIDAASCLAMGLMLIAGTAALSSLFGLDPALIRGAGLVLLPTGLFMLWLGARQSVPAPFVYLVIVGSLLWAAESLVLAGTMRGMTPMGTAFVVIQAMAVASLAALEWVGARRSRAAAA